MREPRHGMQEKRIAIGSENAASRADGRKRRFSLVNRFCGAEAGVPVRCAGQSRMISAMNTRSQSPVLVRPWPQPLGVKVTSPGFTGRTVPLSS